MYTYYDLLEDVSFLSHFNIETGTIGASAEGRLIPYVFLGKKSGAQIIITGGVHAREHVSSYLVKMQIYNLLGEIKEGKEFKGGVYFIPMVNPDGNLIVTEGILSLSVQKRGFIKGLCGNKPELYKANANGVDLNTNFDARWGTGKSNVFAPDSANYVGHSPFSEPETQALKNFTCKINPSATLSYHALGREIYWEFYQDEKSYSRDKKFAEFVNSRLDYKLLDNDFTSAGGYKDWCVEKLMIPSLTIEIVSDCYSHPLTDYSCAAADIERNLDLPVHIIRYLNENN